MTGKHGWIAITKNRSTISWPGADLAWRPHSEDKTNMRVISNLSSNSARKQISIFHQHRIDLNLRWRSARNLAPNTRKTKNTKPQLVLINGDEVENVFVVLSSSVFPLVWILRGTINGLVCGILTHPLLQ